MNKAVQKLLFGAESPLLAAGRVITTQAVGGTGADSPVAVFITVRGNWSRR